MQTMRSSDSRALSFLSMEGGGKMTADLKV